VAAAGISFFQNGLGIMTAADFTATKHVDTFGTPCDYPVQILIGNEPKPVVLPWPLSMINEYLA